MTIRSLVFVAAFVLAASSATAEEAETLRLPDMPLHDPYILAHKPSRTYYLYSSNLRRMTGVNGVGTMVYKSKDLLNWEKPKSSLTVPPTPSPNKAAGLRKSTNTTAVSTFSPRSTTRARSSRNRLMPCNAPMHVAPSSR